MRVRRFFRFRVFFLLLLPFFLSAGVAASPENPEKPVAEESAGAHADKKAFNAGEMIMEHVTDAHEWHVLSAGNFNLVIHLPVILLDEGKLVSFCSSHFEEGTGAYRGYRLEESGPRKGRIVKVLADGVTEDPNAKHPLDFSITKNVMSLFISVLLVCLIFISVAQSYRKHADRGPHGLQSWIEPLILFVRDDIARPSLGEHRYEKFMPYLLTIFFFIFFNNLLGIVPFFPGGANLSGNIAFTMVLAVFTFIITTFSTNKGYWVHIFNAPGVPWWLKLPLPLMPIVEIIGVFTKPFVLMVRLFANMLAGHIIVLGFISIIFIFGAMAPLLGVGVSWMSVAFDIFMSLLELLVAFIQAYVFTMLSALYFSMAKVEHEH